MGSLGTGGWRCVAFVIVVCAAVVSPVLGQQAKPRIYSLRVYTDIKFHFATTLVTSRVLNPATTAREAVFDVTLPNQAFISNFTLEIGGQVYPGQVKEKEAAQKQYDTAKKKGQSAGQVKQAPRETNRFKVEINVGPEEKVTFNLTYQEILERRLGVYEHVVYIDPGQEVEDLSVEVAIEENREITYLHVPPLRNDLLSEVDLTASHSGAAVSRPAVNRAVIRYDPSTVEQLRASSDGLSGLFTVRYDVDRKLDGGELLVVNGYFVHFFAPPVEKPVPKDVLFILDTSTSMQGQKMQQLKDAMQVVLDDMTAEDRFGVMEFNTRATYWRKTLVSATARNIQQAIQYVDNLYATGWTNMDEALQEGIGFLTKEGRELGSGMVIFLTDGVPSTGIRAPAEILKNALRTNSKEMPIYGLAFGKNADWSLVKQLSSQNNGVARRIYEDSDSALQIQGFYQEVSTMLLTRVQARYVDDAVDPASLTQSSFKNYFNGSELIIAGKLLDNTVRSLAVTMEANDAKGDLTLTSTSNALDLDSVTSSGLMSLDDLGKVTEKMWAYLTLKQILKQQVGESDAAKKAELKQKAVELSLKYGFVTPVTSLVVTKPDEDDVGDLQEDDSDLQDDNQPSSSSSSSRRQRPARHRNRGGGGGGSRGGGGGDPHFMMELTTLPYPVCFDVDGSAGDVYRLLRDPRSGLTVNIEMGEGLRKRDHPVTHGGNVYRTYIFSVVVILGDVIMEVTRQHVRVNERQLSWNVEGSVRMPGVWVMMSEDGVLRFVLDSSVEVEVKRWIHPDDVTLGADFLNVEVENEHLLAEDSDGLLGQFVHKKMRMTKLRYRNHKMVARLTSRTGRQQRHGKAYLKNRKDPFFNRTTPCLNLRFHGQELLDHPTDFYRQESDSRAHPAGLSKPQCSEGHHLARGDGATKEAIRPQRGLGEDSTFRHAVRTDDLTANDKKKKKRKRNLACSFPILVQTVPYTASSVFHNDF